MTTHVALKASKVLLAVGLMAKTEEEGREEEEGQIERVDFISRRERERSD